MYVYIYKHSHRYTHTCIILYNISTYIEGPSPSRGEEGVHQTQGHIYIHIHIHICAYFLSVYTVYCSLYFIITCAASACMFDDWRTELPTVLARALWTNRPHCPLKSERHPRILSHVCHAPTLHWRRAQIEVLKGGRFGLFWPVCTHHEEIYCGAKLRQKNAIGVQAAGMLVFLCSLPDFSLLPSKLLRMLRRLFRSLDILAMQLPAWCMPLDMFVLLPKPALHREPLRSSDQPVQMHQILRSNFCNPADRALQIISFVHWF